MTLYLQRCGFRLTEFRARPLSRAEDFIPMPAPDDDDPTYALAAPDARQVGRTHPRSIWIVNIPDFVLAECRPRLVDADPDAFEGMALR